MRCFVLNWRGVRAQLKVKSDSRALIYAYIINELGVLALG